MIVGTRDAAEGTVRKAMEEMVQVNEDHKHSLSRDELIAMLDETDRPVAIRRSEFYPVKLCRRGDGFVSCCAVHAAANLLTVTNGLATPVRIAGRILLS